MTTGLIALSFDTTALFLDLDGTLARFRPRPDDVGPDPARNALLRGLQDALAGRLAIVSGRAIDDVDRILDASVIAVAGVHGLERRLPDGARADAAPHPRLAEARARLETFAAARAGLLVEPKPVSVALHYRGAPDRGPDVRALASLIASETGLKLQQGAMVAELRTPGPNKGDVVRDLLAAPPFAGATPIFVGDDVTDEDGFEAAASLDGWGVLVGPPRPTAARARLPDVGRTLEWLERSFAAGAFTLEPFR